MDGSKLKSSTVKDLKNKNILFEKYELKLKNVYKDFSNCRVGKDISKRKKTSFFGIFGN